MKKLILLLFLSSCKCPTQPDKSIYEDYYRLVCTTAGMVYQGHRRCMNLTDSSYIDISPHP